MYAPIVVMVVRMMAIRKDVAYLRLPNKFVE